MILAQSRWQFVLRIRYERCARHAGNASAGCRKVRRVRAGVHRDQKSRREQVTEAVRVNDLTGSGWPLIEAADVAVLVMKGGIPIPTNAVLERQLLTHAITVLHVCLVTLAVAIVIVSHIAV